MSPHVGAGFLSLATRFPFRSPELPELGEAGNCKPLVSPAQVSFACCRTQPGLRAPNT